MSALPLTGIKVLEFSQMVMGPSCCQILADLGAEVVKVEPIGKGDRTRYLPGLGSGFYTAFNRSKKIVAIDTRSPDGVNLIKEMIPHFDVVVENFRPGLMTKLGLGPADAMAINARLIYCSLKGFLPGPYDQRTALDEVVQMMGGLAYMTGPPGKPMRAGASVNDIMGGMFGVIGIQAALRERETTGRGQEVQASLYENTVFLMGQAMLAHEINGGEEKPLPAQARPWPIYDLFDTADGSQLFIAVVGDSQWETFCRQFGQDELLTDERLTTNADRAAARPWLVPAIQAVLGNLTVAQLIAEVEKTGLPFAPVRTPGQLAHDEHLLASGGLIDVTLPNGNDGKMPAIPLTLGGRRPASAGHTMPVGSDTVGVLEHLGINADRIADLLREAVIEQRQD